MNREVSAKLRRIEDDIRAITIQGATNVAYAVLDGIRLFTREYEGKPKLFFPELKKIGTQLYSVRENEPLARNALKYILFSLGKEKSADIQITKSKVIEACDGYESMIASSKIDMIKVGTEALADEEVILTHCHSSTTVAILKNVAKLRAISGKKKLKVVATETRPLFQGHKTAEELFKSDVNTTLIVDSASASFIVDDTYLPVTAVLVGCDELLKDGSFINKVGSFPLALAAQKGSDNFFVATTLLKLDPFCDVGSPMIEQRDAKEVWTQAPSGLKIINPAFDHVSYRYVTGYITEAGLLTKHNLLKTTKQIYPWIFEKK